MTTIPNIPNANSPLIAEELDFQTFKLDGQYTLNYDPTSTVTMTKSDAGIKLIAPAAAPTTVASSFNALTNELTTTVDGVTVVTTLAELDNEGVALEFSAGNLVLKAKDGTVLSTSPIPDVDAQTLTKTAAATGITIAISGGNSVEISPADLNAMGVQTTPITSNFQYFPATGTSPAQLASTVNGVTTLVPVSAIVSCTNVSEGYTNPPQVATATSVLLGKNCESYTVGSLPINGSQIVAPIPVATLPTLAEQIATAPVSPVNAPGAVPPGYLGADGAIHPMKLIKSSTGIPLYYVVPA